MPNVTATVSIGRGAHNAQEPLSDADWQSFRVLVRTLLEHVGGTVHVRDALSVGEWDGVLEDSSTFVADVPPQTLGTLRVGLRFLAVAFGQQAIALTLGHTEFVTP
jgi:hypothetical protein